MAATSIPTSVLTQLNAMNTGINKLLDDRNRIIGVFDDSLGGSVYNLLTVTNQQIFKDAVVTDMQIAVTSLQAVVTALAAM